MAAGGSRNGVGEIFRRLRPGDNDAAAEHKTRHAIDARFLGAVGLALDAFDIVVA